MKKIFNINNAKRIFYIIIALYISILACNNDGENSPAHIHYVASAGQSNTDGIIRHSYTATNWYAGNMTTISQTSYIKGIVYGEGHFIAVGTGFYTYESEDGIQWNLTNLGTETTYNDIALGEYHNQSPWTPYYVAVGQNGSVIYSSDYGQSWANGTTGITEHLNGIAFAYTTSGLSMFVAVGASEILVNMSDPSPGTIIYSITAGETWIQHSAGGNSADLFCVAYGNGRFIAAGEQGVMLYSTNGASWQTATSNTSADIYGISYGIVNNSPIWIAVGEEGTILYSQDNGNNWTEQEVDADKSWNSVIIGDNKALAVGYGRDGGYTNGVEGKIIYSTDGINWQTAEIFAGHENYFRDIAYRQ